MRTQSSSARAEAVRPAAEVSSFRRQEILSLALFAALSVALMWRLAPGTRERWPGALAALALGILSMDFISGLFHWAADTWGTVEWPWIGPNVIRTFREHHTDPEGITRHDPIEVNATNAMIAIPVLCIGHWVIDDNYFGAAYSLAIALSSLITNQIHRWAHRSENPGWVRRLQKLGLILSPEAHALHHVAPHTDHYCITTGWLNHPLARIRFFRGLECIVSRVTGAVPRADDEAHRQS